MIKLPSNVDSVVPSALVAGVNDTFWLAEFDVALTITGVSVTDIDTNLTSSVISVTNGTLTVVPNGATVSNNGTGFYKTNCKTTSLDFHVGLL